LEDYFGGEGWGVREEVNLETDEKKSTTKVIAVLILCLALAQYENFSDSCTHELQHAINTS